MFDRTGVGLGAVARSGAEEDAGGSGMGAGRRGAGRDADMGQTRGQTHLPSYQQYDHINNFMVFICVSVAVVVLSIVCKSQYSLP